MSDLKDRVDRLSLTLGSLNYDPVPRHELISAIRHVGEEVRRILQERLEDERAAAR